jgi:hypothetical protein
LSRSRQLGRDLFRVEQISAIQDILNGAPRSPRPPVQAGLSYSRALARHAKPRDSRWAPAISCPASRGQAIVRLLLQSRRTSVLIGLRLTQLLKQPLDEIPRTRKSAPPAFFT